ncbi:hypothetical protein FMEAI12_2840010 [Parafrankia sp. Ea1.12]|nr:hypothetical protein FMEAI12_2840010 [Parafrankia sp. Ea1.12]
MARLSPGRAANALEVAGRGGTGWVSDLTASLVAAGRRMRRAIACGGGCRVSGAAWPWPWHWHWQAGSRRPAGAGW